uniref:Uncharacterized protein n=1 Tax=Chlorocebus sabaeus TaxID=60711 RepID=A0A0D9RB14_CHLSB
MICKTGKQPGQSQGRPADGPVERRLTPEQAVCPKDLPRDHTPLCHSLWQRPETSRCHLHLAPLSLSLDGEGGSPARGPQEAEGSLYRRFPTAGSRAPGSSVPALPYIFFHTAAETRMPTNSFRTKGSSGTTYVFASYVP